MYCRRNIFVLIFIILIAFNFSVIAFSGEVIWECKKWYPIEINFQGPDMKEMDSDPNPFLDYRLQVIFTSPGNIKYNVPGFFTGDGKGEGNGNIWTVRFTPDETGTWNYTTSFREGKNIAVDLDPNAGKSAMFDGESGSLNVSKGNPDAPGFLKWGRLLYNGGHYLKFTDGPYWIKGGTDEPEDLLSYADFDNTLNAGHKYSAHIADWQKGDPTWQGGKGKAIIGMLDYLSSQNVNSIYFLVQNIGGDGKNVWPFAGKINPEGSPDNDNLHYDISKLHQWNIVFEHAQRKGVFLHFVLNEAEEMNKRELDNAELGIERKLYYREIIARFGHHNALQWNLCEEYDLDFNLTPKRIKEFAQYIIDVDPYHHPVTVHNEGLDPEPNWFPFLGDKRISTTSFQFYLGNAKWGEHVEKWRRLTEVAGRPLPINLDEFMKVSQGNQAQERKEMLWPTYLSGGNLEYILEGARSIEDFKVFEKMWQWTWYARDFMEKYLPYWEMEPDDMRLINGTTDLGGPQVLAKPGEIYAIYLPIAQPAGELRLWDDDGTFEQQWYNPRTGQFEGSQQRYQAKETIKLGQTPRDPQEDWVILIKKLSD